MTKTRVLDVVFLLINVIIVFILFILRMRQIQKRLEQQMLYDENESKFEEFVDGWHAMVADYAKKHPALNDGQPVILVLTNSDHLEKNIVFKKNDPYITAVEFHFDNISDYTEPTESKIDVGYSKTSSERDKDIDTVVTAIKKDMDINRPKVLQNELEMANIEMEKILTNNVVQHWGQNAIDNMWTTIHELYPQIKKNSVKTHKLITGVQALWRGMYNKPFSKYIALRECIENGFSIPISLDLPYVAIVLQIFVSHLTKKRQMFFSESQG